MGLGQSFHISTQCGYITADLLCLFRFRYPIQIQNRKSRTAADTDRILILWIISRILNIKSASLFHIRTGQFRNRNLIPSHFQSHRPGQTAGFCILLRKYELQFCVSTGFHSGISHIYDNVLFCRSCYAQRLTGHQSSHRQSLVFQRSNIRINL